MKTKEISQAIRNNLESAAFDAVLTFGIRNIQYASGLDLPQACAQKDKAVALLWAKSGGPVLFIPEDWADATGGQVRVKDVRPYSAGKGSGELAALIAQAVGEYSGVTTIGIDREAVPVFLYSLLERQLKSVQFKGCDDFFRTLRSRKTPYETEMLKTLAMKVDHAVNGCLHHITVDRRMSELTLAEELRIHSLERDMEMQGYNCCSQVAGGEETREFWPNTPKFGYAKTRDLKPGDLIRVQMQQVKDGYWASSARMMVNNDHLSDKQSEGYTFLNEVHSLIMKELKPGASCRDVFRNVSKAAGSRNIPLAAELGLGHGIGVSPFEPPYLAESDDTVLEAGMVLVVDPVIRAADGIYRSRNTVIINSSSAEIVGWYKNWSEPYTPILSI